MIDTNLTVEILNSSTGDLVYTGVIHAPALGQIYEMIMIFFAVFVFIELLEMIFYNRRV